MSSAFTYQGRLMAGGAPATGYYDFRFELFPTEADGIPHAGPVTNANIAVAAGVFTATLDFGTNVFSGAGCWLEVAVRPAGQSAAFIALRPRQPLTPTPYSLYTLKAERLTGPLPDSQLSTNIARLDANQTFSGTVTFGGAVNVAGSFSGNGAGLSNVVAGTLSSRAAQRLWRVSIPFVTVTNAGNATNTDGKGAVAYPFRVGKYEINHHQYAGFLNAVAGDDPNGLYSTNMAATVHGGIERTGSPGEYSYTVKPGMGHRPVGWVDFRDAVRFCNWLHHGQPVGAQDGTTTEDGAYTLTPEALAANTVTRNPGARFWLPSDDEWYKAAYHQPFEVGGDQDEFWHYPTRSNDVPFAEPPPGGANSINACCETGRMATDVGAYSGAPSFYGTFDQGGNLQEWTEEVIFVTARRLRGGSWNYNEFYSGASDFEFDTIDYDEAAIGFRVAGAVDP